MTDVAPPLPDDRRRAFLIAWGLCSAFLIMTCTVNAVSSLRDFPRVEPVEPSIWEYSSGLLHIVLIPAVAWLLRRAPPGPGRWVRFAAAHIAGSIVYSFIHVGGFQLIRVGIYRLVGASYGPPDWLYEYRKDVLTYA